jgi:hypothetical protein
MTTSDVIVNVPMSAGDLAALIEAVTSAQPHQDETFAPPVPQRLEETGLTEAVIEELILKTLFTRGEVIGRDSRRRDRLEV